MVAQIEEVRLSTMTRNLVKTIWESKATARLRNILAADRLSIHYSSLLNSEKDPEFFFRESGGATTLANATKAIGPAVRRVKATDSGRNPPPAGPSFFTDPESGLVTAPDVSSFIDPMPHRIDVRIGTANRMDPNEIPFPFERLPRQQGAHRLTVVFTEPVMAAQPQVAHIFLPLGSSNACSFYLVPKTNHSGVQARISVLYQNRVLQTSILEGAIIGERDKAADNSVISLHPEVVVSPGMSDLDQQRGFGAALILNHTANEAQVTKIVNDSAELVSVSNLSEWVDQIEDRLGRSDWGAKNMRSIDGAGTLDLLIFLARHGSLLYNGIVKQQFEDQTLRAAKRIQLIAAKPGTRLPVEYFYELKSPLGEKRSCSVLHCGGPVQGQCSCSCGRKDQSSYVCPMGFWGINRVLEWHVYRPAWAKELGNRDYALQEDKIANRKHLVVMEQALVSEHSSRRRGKR